MKTLGAEKWLTLIVDITTGRPKKNSKSSITIFDKNKPPLVVVITWTLILDPGSWILDIASLHDQYSGYLQN
jgi:hypothetical protein